MQRLSRVCLPAFQRKEESFHLPISSPVEKVNHTKESLSGRLEDGCDRQYMRATIRTTSGSYLTNSNRPKVMRSFTSCRHDLIPDNLEEIRTVLFSASHAHSRFPFTWLQAALRSVHLPLSIRRFASHSHLSLQIGFYPFLVVSFIPQSRCLKKNGCSALHTTFTSPASTSRPSTKGVAIASASPTS